MCGCHSIPECCVMFSGVKLSMGSFILFINPVELKQAFDRACRSYRINGRSRMDVETFLDRIRQNLIDLMNKELTDLDSARV